MRVGWKGVPKKRRFGWDEVERVVVEDSEGGLSIVAEFSDSSELLSMMDGPAIWCCPWMGVVGEKLKTELVDG